MKAALRIVTFLAATLMIGGPASRPDSAAPAAPWAPGQVAVQRSVQRLSAWTFVTTIARRTYPLGFDREAAEMGEPRRPSTEIIVLSQIREPLGADERAWNAQVRAQIPGLLRTAYRDITESDGPEPARQTSVEVGVQVTGAAPGTIAAQTRAYIYRHGAMKAWVDSARPLLWSLRERRPLTADDLLDPRTRWWEALVPLVTSQAYGEPVAVPVKGYERLARRQAPEIQPGGMCLQFDEDEGGSHVLDQPHCLPWKALQPYLRKRLPFDRDAFRFRDPLWD